MQVLCICMAIRAACPFPSPNVDSIGLKIFHCAISTQGRCNSEAHMK